MIEVSDEVRTSLSRAGIGRAYHARSLAEFPDTHPTRAFFRRISPADIRAGRGFVLLGANPLDYDAFVLSARLLHLNGVGVGLVNMTDLIDHITRVDRDKRIERATALFVKGFYAPQRGIPAPYDPREMRRVQHFLDDRLDEGYPVFLQAAEPLTPQQPGWWREDFVARLMRVCETVEARS